MLSDRRQLVLRALIEEYIAFALPVGSRTLVERYHLGYSPATIRNELSQLEEEGYLEQPHTSAGRIPTDHGYRAFVDELLESIDESVDDASIAEIRKAAKEVDDLFEKTSLALTRLTDCLSFVVPPRLLSVRIQTVKLVQLTDHRAILIVITEDGQVLDRHLEFADVLDPLKLHGAQERLNDILAGKSLSKDAHELLRLIDRSSDPLLRSLLTELRSCIAEHRDKRPYTLGMANLMAQPEFRASANLLPVLAELEEDTVLLHVLDETLNQDRPVVRIGHENGCAGLAGVSLVASRFGEGDQMGLVAILGPTRMNYSQVLRAVQAAKGVLGDL
jgi:heat-inducible transcriptional repressor